MMLLSRPVDVTNQSLQWIYDTCPHVHIETVNGTIRVWGHFFVIEYENPQCLVEALRK